MNNKMTKYYIGFAAIGVVVLGLLIYTISLGASSKQDAKTEKKASEIAQKLNSYVAKNYKSPDSLKDVGVTDAPDTIKYTKNSDGTYKICVTYKTASNYNADPTSILWGGGISQADQSSYDDYSSSYDKYQSSTLYFSYYHKKGETCKTVKSIQYNTNNYNFDDSYSSSSSSSSNSTVSNSANDTERQTDLKAIGSEEHTSELQSHHDLVCRLLLEKKKHKIQ